MIMKELKRNSDFNENISSLYKQLEKVQTLIKSGLNCMMSYHKTGKI